MPLSDQNLLVSPLFVRSKAQVLRVILKVLQDLTLGLVLPPFIQFLAP